MLYLFLDHRIFWDLAIEWKKLLQEHFKRPVKIINHIPNQMKEHLVIMFGLNHYQGLMPFNYIAVQLEQSSDSQWFTKRYLALLQNALAVWDYSMTNWKNLQVNNLNYYCLSLGYSQQWNQLSEHPEKKYDILFMGQLNQRRQTILQQLENAGYRC